MTELPRYYIEFKEVNGKHVLSILDSHSGREIFIKDTAVDYDNIVIAISHFLKDEFI